MPPSPGTRLGHYDVVALIDEGGGDMGQGWQAHHMRCGRDTVNST